MHAWPKNAHCPHPQTPAALTNCPPTVNHNTHDVNSKLAPDVTSNCLVSPLVGVSAARLKKALSCSSPRGHLSHNPVACRRLHREQARYLIPNRPRWRHNPHPPSRGPWHREPKARKKIVIDTLAPPALSHGRYHATGSPGRPIAAEDCRMCPSLNYSRMRPR